MPESKRSLRTFAALLVALLLGLGLFLVLRDEAPDPAEAPRASSTPSPEAPSPRRSVAPGPEPRATRAAGAAASPGSPTPRPRLPDGAPAGWPLSVALRVTLDGEPVAAQVSAQSGGAVARVTCDERGRGRLALPRDARLDLRAEAGGVRRFAVDLLEPGAPIYPSLDVEETASLEIGEAPIQEDFTPAPAGGVLDFAAMVVEPDQLVGRELRIALVSRLLVRGKVLDAEGQGAGGVKVLLGRSLSATSEDDGAFALRGPVGSFGPLDEVCADAGAGGYASAPPEEGEQDGCLVFEVGELRLRGGATLEGRVTDEQGRGLPAWIRAGVGGVLAQRGWTLRADAEGRFALVGVDEREDAWVDLELVVRHPGYAPLRVQASRPLQGEPLRLSLAPLARCRGRVVDASGRPQRARLRLVRDPRELARRYGVHQGGGHLDALLDDGRGAAFDGGPGRSAERLRHTDDQGRFELELGEGESRWLLVRAAGHGERVVELRGSEQELRVELPKGLPLAGTLHTAGSGEPLDYRTLIAAPAGQHPDQALERAPAFRGETRSLAAGESPTALGAAEVREGRFRVEDLPPGRCDLYVLGVQENAWRPILVAEGVEAGREDLTLRFPVPPKGTIRLRVLDAQGQPVENPGAILRDEAGEQIGYGAAGGKPGELLVETWSFGALSLEVRAVGYLPVQRTLNLQPNQNLDLGRVELAAGGAAIRLEVRGRHRFSSVMVEAQDPLTRSWVHAGSSLDGSREVFHLAPGAARVRLLCYGAGEEPLRTFLREVPLAPGASAELTIEVRRD